MGAILRRLILVVVVLWFSATSLAQGASEATRPEEPGVHWFAPTFGYVDHPLHAAVAVIASPEPFRLEGHTDLQITVTLDDIVQLDTTSVHEHDGFHTIVLTPPRAGMLRLYAGDGPGHDHPEANDPPGRASDAVMVEIPIREAVPDDPTYPPGHDPPGIWTDGDAVMLTSGDHYAPNQWLYDLVDPSGRLVQSLWPGPNGWSSVPVWPPLGGFADSTVRAIWTSYPTGNNTIHTQSFELSFTGAPRSQGVRLDGPVSPAECTSDDTRLVTDPDSVTSDGLAWQQWTDVRFALARDDYVRWLAPVPAQQHNGVEASAYSLFGTEYIGTQPMMHGWGAYDVIDPFRELTLRFPGPGHYELEVHTRDWDYMAGCTIGFTILPNTDNEPGKVVHAIRVNGTSAAIVLAAIRGYDTLAHYEFDTRVYKVETGETPGRLVWKGKLHGHEGAAAFRLYDLDPGHYEVRTYPSPQDLGTPPVVAESEQGFVYTFTIEAPPAYEPPSIAEDRVVQVPAPAGLLAVLGVLGLPLLRRR